MNENNTSSENQAYKKKMIHTTLLGVLIAVAILLVALTTDDGTSHYGELMNVCKYLIIAFLSITLYVTVMTAIRYYQNHKKKIKQQPEEANS